MCVLLVSGLCGGLAGSAVDFVLFPLDTLKTRAQSLPVAPDLASAARAGVQWRSFYAGLASTMAGSFPSAAVFFAAYEGSKALLEPQLPSYLHALSHAVSASLANVAACTVRVPFEVVKQRLQAGVQRSTQAAVGELWRSGGFGAFYTGYASTVLREIPFDSVQFALWEFLKRYYRLKYAPDRALTPFESASCGAAAGAVAAAVTNPLDVIKTRLMTQRIDNGPPHQQHLPRYSGWRDCFEQVWRQEGLRGMSAGFTSRVAWISLGGFVFFGAYDAFKNLLTSSSTSSFSNDDDDDSY